MTQAAQAAQTKQNKKAVAGFNPAVTEEALRSKGYKKVELIENIPTCVPGKEGNREGTFAMMPGTVVEGRYVHSKFVESESLQQGQRALHTLESTTYRDEEDRPMRFGIWGVGSLDSVLPRLDQGTLLAIKYLGKAEKPLKKGQEPPHEFEFMTPEGAPLDIDWDRELRYGVARAAGSGIALDSASE